MTRNWSTESKNLEKIIRKLKYKEDFKNSPDSKIGYKERIQYLELYAGNLLFENTRWKRKNL
jgi:hypothetical protein